MRNSNINNSIANVISRFSARVDSMLCAITAPQHQWHLQPYANLGTVDAPITGGDMPVYLTGTSEPTCDLTIGKVVRKQRQFQRLS
jgi:hypothetical protein